MTTNIKPVCGAALAAAVLLLGTACTSKLPQHKMQEQKPMEEMPMVGGDRDKYGCIGSAGYSWSVIRRQCIQPFENPDIRLADPDNDTLAAYVFLSADKSRAELFASGVPDHAVLEAVKGGYAARDGRIRLMRAGNGWRLIRRP